MKIKITADSTCSLGSAHGDKIGIIPLHVVTDTGEMLDGVNIHPDDIYAAVAAGRAIPKTAAINVAEYTELFERELGSADAIVHISLGSEFSSSHKNALLAAEDLPVWCVDSRMLAMGSGLQAEKALEWAESGMSAEDIARKIPEYAATINGSFIIEKLDYLRAGGRCSSLAALGANLLKLHPIIELRDGLLKVGKKYRGSYEKCVTQYITERLSIPGIDRKRLVIEHSGMDEELIDLFKAAAKEVIPFDRVDVVRTGCTISSHCGPNTIGMFVTVNE